MFRQYFKQAIQILKENRLTSVISILGTALSIAMILVVILQFQIKLVGFRPESNRDRVSRSCTIWVMRSLSLRMTPRNFFSVAGAS